MTTDGYQARQDILHEHAMHIKDLSKNNAALSLKLHVAESKIGDLNIEVDQLRNERLVSVTKLKDAENEIRRLGMVLRHQATIV